MSKFLYLIKCNEFYKIGSTNNLQTRLTELQTGNPYPLEIDVFWESYSAGSLETCLHNTFSGKRVIGEWFVLDRSDIDKIDQICSLLNCFKHSAVIKSEPDDVDYENVDDDEPSSCGITRREFVELWNLGRSKSISALAKEMGVNPRTAQKWVAYGTAYRDVMDGGSSAQAD